MQDGLVIPLTLACRNPSILSTGSEYQLLVGSGDAGTADLPVPPASGAAASKAPAQAAAVPPAAPQEKQMIADDEQTEYAMSEIVRFVAGLRIRNILTKHEAQSLEDLLFENGTLLYAAYSVAVSASDAEYLAEICRDLAQSLQSEAGPHPASPPAQRSASDAETETGPPAPAPPPGPPQPVARPKKGGGAAPPSSSREPRLDRPAEDAGATRERAQLSALQKELLQLARIEEAALRQSSLDARSWRRRPPSAGRPAASPPPHVTIRLPSSGGARGRADQAALSPGAAEAAAAFRRELRRELVQAKAQNRAARAQRLDADAATAALHRKLDRQVLAETRYEAAQAEAARAQRLDAAAATAALHRELDRQALEEAQKEAAQRRSQAAQTDAAAAATAALHRELDRQARAEAQNRAAPRSPDAATATAASAQDLRRQRGLGRRALTEAKLEAARQRSRAGGRQAALTHGSLGAAEAASARHPEPQMQQEPDRRDPAEARQLAAYAERHGEGRAPHRLLLLLRPTHIRPTRRLRRSRRSPRPQRRSGARAAEKPADRPTRRRPG